MAWTCIDNNRLHIDDSSHFEYFNSSGQQLFMTSCYVAEASWHTVGHIFQIFFLIYRLLILVLTLELSSVDSGPKGD